MSRIAILIGAAFVMFLLRCDRKQTPNVSRALWIPTIWMLYEAGRPLAAWFMVSEDAASSPMDQAFLGGLLCLSIVVLAKRRVNWSSAMRENVWLMVLLGYMLLSVLWSNIMFISFKRWIRELEAVAMAFIVLTENNPRLALESLLRRVVYIHIPLSMVLVKYLPEYGVQFNRWTGDIMWVGVSTQKNGLGVLCLISAYFIVWTLLRRRQGRNTPASKYQTPAEILLLVLTLLLLKGPPGAYSSVSGYSSTSIAALGIGLTTLLGLSWMRKRGSVMGANTVSALVILIICYGTTLPLVGGNLGGSLTSALGRDGTFTGRTDIWAELVPVVKAAPVLGCGFGGFWTPETRAIHIIGQAHNGYLQVLMELGSVGLVLVSIFMLASARKAVRALGEDFDLASIGIGLVLMAVLHNATEATINSFTNFLTAVILMVSTCIAASPVCRHYEEDRDTQKKNVSRNATTPSACTPAPTS